MSNIELKCISFSHEAKLTSARKRLSELKLNTLSFVNPLGDLGRGIEWKGSLPERVKRVILLPIAFLLIFFVYASVPIVYLLDLWGMVQKKRDIKLEISGLKSCVSEQQLPTKKTLDILVV